MNIKIRRGIRITRVVALAMITAPEPISTALGIVILSILTIPTLMLRHQDIHKKLYLRHILTDYARTYRPYGYGPDYKPVTSASLPYRFRKPIFKSNARTTDSLAYENMIKTNPPSEPVFHVFNRELVSKRFTNSDRSSKFEGCQNLDCKTKTITPVYHRFDRLSPAKRFDSGGSRSGFVGYWGKKSYVDIKASPSVRKILYTP